MGFVLKPVHLFPSAPGGITLETKIPLARRSNAEPPEDYHFTPAELIDFLEANGAIFSQGIYSSDEAAGLDGVAIEEYYETGIGHVDGLPPGVIKKRLI